jgi:hypothetical protein
LPVVIDLPKTVGAKDALVIALLWLIEGLAIDGVRSSPAQGLPVLATGYVPKTSILLGFTWGKSIDKRHGYIE